MQFKMPRIQSALALLIPAIFGLTLLSGCGGGGGAPPAEVQQQNIQDELKANDPSNFPDPGA